LYCLACGDGECDPHETVMNCMEDCPEGCLAGHEVEYLCDNGSQIPWCYCKAPECVPECWHIGSESEGWYDPCTSDLYRWDFCSDCEAACEEEGSWSEGWYPVCSGGAEQEVIVYTGCTPRWSCIDDPTAECP
jgi:hypothetical protein